MDIEPANENQVKPCDVSETTRKERYEAFSAARQKMMAAYVEWLLAGPSHVDRFDELMSTNQAIRSLNAIVR